MWFGGVVFAARRLGLLAALLASALAAGAAYASDASEARYFDERARAAYARREYREALDLFLLSHAAAPSASALYNAGVCAHLHHDDELAFAVLTEFLASGDTDAERVADARERLDDLGRDLAVLRIETDPPGALIFVDREALGSFGRSPATIPVEPGEHTLLMRLDGHLSVEVAVTARRGAESVVRSALMARTGRLVVRGLSPQARVEAIDAAGSSVALDVAAASTEGIPLRMGRWVLRAAAEGRRPFEAVLEVREGETSELDVALEALAAPTGRLLVSAGAREGVVHLDGQRIGELPLALDGVSEGAHRIEVVLPGEPPFTAPVVIEAARTTLLEVPAPPR